MAQVAGRTGSSAWLQSHMNRPVIDEGMDHDQEPLKALITGTMLQLILLYARQLSISVRDLHEYKRG